jgi:hypothetical protein
MILNCKLAPAAAGKLVRAGAACAQLLGAGAALRCTGCAGS